MTAIKKFFWGLYCSAGVLLVLWAIVSWFDIIADNIAPNPQHWDFNLFLLLIRFFEMLK